MIALLRRSRLVAVIVLAVFGVAPASASPRDAALRLAPPDSALVLLVQDARGHVHEIAQSPFARWLPTSSLGKQFLPMADLGAIKGAVAPLFAELGVTPDELLDDVVGDAIVFAFTPAPSDKPKDERAVILIRPRKPETLAKVIDKLNAIQTKNGELKEIVRRTHNGETYYERQKSGAGAASEFYCFRDGVFAFSTTEPDIKAVIDRDRTTPPVAEKAPEFTARLTRLGVVDSVLVMLVNPRPIDADLKARIEKAKPEDRPFLERFQEVWLALDTAAVYVSLGHDLELGVSVHFRPDALPPATRNWLVGPRKPTALWAAVPDGALFAVAGQFRPKDVIDTVGSLVPDKDKNPLKAIVEQSLGPVVGKDKLPLVLDSLGPDWGIWAVPPANEADFLPTIIGAVRVTGNGDAARVLLDALDYGFRTLRVLYNSGHTDQIDIKETHDGDVLIRSLANEKGFPPGFRPAFAFKGGYLLIATSPEAIQAFKPPGGAPMAGGDVPIARFSGTETRAYLLANRTKLAKFLADAGHGNEKELFSQIEQFAVILEPVERVELLTRGDAEGLRLAVRVKFVKPLK